jgi:hypothetical protein
MGCAPVTAEFSISELGGYWLAYLGIVQVSNHGEKNCASFGFELSYSNPMLHTYLHINNMFSKKNGSKANKKYQDFLVVLPHKKMGKFTVPFALNKGKKFKSICTTKTFIS